MCDLGFQVEINVWFKILYRNEKIKIKIKKNCKSSINIELNYKTKKATLMLSNPKVRFLWTQCHPAARLLSFSLKLSLLDLSLIWFFNFNGENQQMRDRWGMMAGFTSSSPHLLHAQGQLHFATLVHVVHSHPLLYDPSNPFW